MDQTTMNRYSFVKEVGKGAYGTVWKAVDKMMNKVVAVKKINSKVFQWQECLNVAEVRCLKELVHPNVVSLNNVIMENNTLYLVFEWMESDLSDIIKAKGRPFSEEEVRNISFQLFKAVEHMHKEGYCHRDLKPENVLVSGDVIKIADFGLAINMLYEAGKPLPSYVATRPYRAPELLLGSTDYDFAIDIWAMGVIMVQLFTRYPLFLCSNAANQIRKICHVIGSPNTQTWPRGLEIASSINYSFPKEFTSVDSTKRLSSLLGRSVSAQAIDLIKHLLSWDPKNRPKAIEALKHPFFYPCYNIKTPISQKDGNNRPTSLTVGEFKCGSQYSIREQKSYLGSYQIPAPSSFTNLQSYQFPGMFPKRFNPRVPDDKINTLQGFGD